MIRRLLMLVVCVVTSSVVYAAPAADKPPKALLEQVQRLTDLMQDGYATGYPEATMVQLVNEQAGEGQGLALVVFTIEGFGGGNNYTQYFAAFSSGENRQGELHFTLIDVIPVAGKGWRGIMKLDAKVTRNPKADETRIAFDGWEVVEGDGPNFPSKQVMIHLLLKGGRLVEQKRP